MQMIEQATELEKQGRPDAALDVVYSQLDSAFHAGKFQKVDELLLDLDVDKVPTNILLGIMTITWAARRSLRNRREFCWRAKAAVVERGDYCMGLFDNLMEEPQTRITQQGDKAFLEVQLSGEFIAFLRPGELNAELARMGFRATHRDLVRCPASYSAHLRQPIGHTRLFDIYEGCEDGLVD